MGDPPSVRSPQIKGAIHVHTTLSDGGGTPEEVIAEARAAGLGFVILTDHNNLDAKRFEGYHDGLLVIVGTEISATAGHLLGLGIPDPVYRFSGDARDGLDDVRDLGGFSFAAHPTSPRPDFRWTGWDLPGSWGIELLNGDSLWREAGWGRLAWASVLYGLNERYALLRTLTSPDSTLARWDSLLRERDVAGIAGSDAHSRLVLRKNTALRIPSYRSLLGVVQNHVLLQAPLSGDAERDAAAVVAALGQGRSYVGLDALADASEFFFEAEFPGGRRIGMGETTRWEPGELRAGGRLPSGARIHLLKDGAVQVEGVGTVQGVVNGPGVYRAEVRVPGWDVPWVLANPIYVFDPPQAVARGKRAAGPPPSPTPAVASVLESFDGAPTFTPEFDPSSSMVAPIVDAKGGSDGKGAARIQFRLGVPGPDRPHTWCALANRLNRDLTGRTGLVFKLRADGVYRMWVQVRDENPASADEGTEWWFASVRTSTSWRDLAVPFASLRSINPRTDGRLDLDKVRALFFTLDRGAVKPGTSGTIWLDDIGLY